MLDVVGSGCSRTLILPTDACGTERWSIVRARDRERQQLILQIKTVASLIEQASNFSQISRYIEELDKLKAELVSMESPGSKTEFPP